MLDPQVLTAEDKPQSLRGWFVGQVVANDDPETHGRVRVEIPGLTKGQPVESLPWYNVMQPAYLGGSQYTTITGVPQINTTVVVVFPDGESVFSGWVIGSLVNQVTFPMDNLNLTKDYMSPKASEHHFTENWDPVDDSKPGQRHFSPDFGEDYPFCHGWVDNALNWVKVNMLKRSFEFVTNALFKFKNYGNGNTVIHFPKNAKIVIDGDLYLEVRGQTDMIHFNHLYQHVIGNRIDMIEQQNQRTAKAGIIDNGKTIHHN